MILINDLQQNNTVEKCFISIISYTVIIHQFRVSLNSASCPGLTDQQKLFSRRNNFYCSSFSQNHTIFCFIFILWLFFFFPCLWVQFFVFTRLSNYHSFCLTLRGSRSVRLHSWIPPQLYFQALKCMILNHKINFFVRLPTLLLKK